MNWESDFLSLAPRNKPTQSMLKLGDAGIQQVKDLLWINPLRVQEKPKLSDFSQIHIDKLFIGKAKFIHIKAVPAFGRRGKKKIQLFNIQAVAKDAFSEKYINMRWFNTYPSQKKQFEQLDDFTFMGTPSDFKGTVQFINPKINPNQAYNISDDMLIEYPTVNTVPGIQVQKIINYIPSNLWDENLSDWDQFISQKFKLIPAIGAFKILHGLEKSTDADINSAKERVIYQEFQENQLKLLARRLKHKRLKAPVINDINFDSFKKLFSYSLTLDQDKVLGHIQNDFESGHQMMRLVQGDVGCGKTTVAIISMLALVQHNYQVAFMCPTEALATQHFKTVMTLNHQTKVSLLLGSTKTAEKKQIYMDLKNGDIDFIIGTHSLIQENVEFFNLGLAIIDEQHKFGVEQRQKLTRKGNGVHTLIMTATPIPRSLQLAQYGDLDISTIRTIPKGRKGVQTRIVTETTYSKYLSFLKTRLELKEQIYIVAPAIEESETLDIKNVNSIFEQYQRFFPEHKIDVLHGQLKSDEKQKIMDSFKNGDIEILISTTVIEVGIDVANSTVMSIYNPDRFGLSSLHQLRGRVGRSEKPGFCFLITDKSISSDSLKRIKVIEKTTDGFEIAEADLRNRGQGDLFGPNQSGHISQFRIANIVEHLPIFEKVTQDIEELKKNAPERLNNKLLSYLEDTKVSTTI